MKINKKCIFSCFIVPVMLVVSLPFAALAIAFDRLSKKFNKKNYEGL